MPPRSVRVVVLNYNGGEHVLRCADALEAIDWPADRLDLVVVDNASSDGSRRALEARRRLRVIALDENRGFPANNAAMADLDGVDYLALVNNDAFVSPGWLQPLVATLEADAGLGAACPKIVLAERFVDLPLSSPTWSPPNDGRHLGVRISGVEAAGADLWRRCGFGDGFWGPERGGAAEPEFRWSGAEATLRVPVDDQGRPPASVRLRLAAESPITVRIGVDDRTVEVGRDPAWFEAEPAGEAYDVINNVGSMLVEGGWGADRGFLERDRGQYEDATEVFAWCGAAVLFRCDYLLDTGLFDERFFMYYEDTDLAWRGRLRGWRYRYEPASVVRHVHAATSVEGSPLFQHYVERNRLLMLAKNAPAGMAAGAAGRFLLSTLSYARRDILGPLRRRRRPAIGLVRARLRSFVAFVRLLGPTLGARRRIRREATVHDEAILGWAQRK